MTDMLSQLAALAGIDELLPASFRGVPFECLSTSDALARDTVSYAYPYQDGATIEDHGLRPVSFKLTAFLFGHDWKQQLKALLTTFKSADTGELVHPVYGSIPHARFMSAGVEKQVEPLNAVTVELVFTEAGTEQALFATASANQAPESIFSTGNHLLDSAASAFSTAMKDIRKLENGVERINTIIAQGEYLLGEVRGEIQGAVASVSNLLDTPSALISDLKGMLGTFSDTLNLTGESVKSDWQQATHLAGKVLSLPTAWINARSVTTITRPFALPLSQVTAVRASDTQLLTRTARLVTVSELAAVATTIMQNEVAAPALTSTWIEAIVNDVRRPVMTALRETRAAMQQDITTAALAGFTADTRTHSAIISDLQRTAWTLQAQAMGLIQQRPPLITRPVTRRANLHLLAFDWYGDPERAQELLRLNPSLGNPGDLQPGMTLYAWAR
ncbi:Mu-like prophage DNA circulation protein [Cedecea sp. NFIX57]|nr:Mu-like prophage DNA circulation protein [Cedecea sp. NFIX57]